MNAVLVGYFVLVVMDLKTRRLHLAGIAHQMYGKWMDQVARSLTDPTVAFCGARASSFATATHRSRPGLPRHSGRRG